MTYASLSSYVILFILGFIEGSVVTVGVGLTAPLLGMDVWISLVILIVADILSDLAYYFLGRTGSKYVHGRYAKYIGITSQRMSRVEEYYRKHGAVTVVFAKFSDILAAPGIIIAGAVGMRLRTFALISIGCSLCKTPILYFGGVFISLGLFSIGAPLLLAIISGIALLSLGVTLLIYFYRKIG